MYQKEITHLMVQSIKEVTGKGPSLVKLTVSENIINVDIKGALTILEQSLLKKSLDNKVLVKAIRKQLMELVSNNFSIELQNFTKIADLKIVNYTFIMDYENDRQIMVFVCNKFLTE